jgi:hypothetical protein
MPFDVGWFDELRALSQGQLEETRARGIERFVPNVGELCAAGCVSPRFLNETTAFVEMMAQTPYPLDRFFRAHERHVFNFPKGRAFHKQWNIGFTAGKDPRGDCVRVGVGFTLPPQESDGYVEYLTFLRQVQGRRADFDRIFQALGNYCEFIEPPERSIAGRAAVPLSAIVVDDELPLSGWRFFGRCLRAHEVQDQAIIRSHEQLSVAAVSVFDQIQGAGFGM